MSLKPVKLFKSIIRNASTKPLTNDSIAPFLNNRNPRNLERLRLDRKPSGYGLDEVFVQFWHKLELLSFSKYVAAQLIYNTGKVVVEASTNEWAIYKHLYSKTDKVAYITLAKVFAERCLESGLNECACTIVPSDSNTKVDLFLKTLQDEGLVLTEMNEFDIHDIWNKKEKRPWTTLED